MLASVPPLYYDVSDHIIGSDKRFWFMDFKQQYCDASDFRLMLFFLCADQLGRTWWNIPTRSQSNCDNDV